MIPTNTSLETKKSFQVMAPRGPGEGPPPHGRIPPPACLCPGHIQHGFFTGGAKSKGNMVPPQAGEVHPPLCKHGQPQLGGLSHQENGMGALKIHGACLPLAIRTAHLVPPSRERVIPLPLCQAVYHRGGFLSFPRLPPAGRIFSQGGRPFPPGSLAGRPLLWQNRNIPSRELSPAGAALP